MTRGIIVQNCVWHLQIFFASNHLRSIFVFLLRSSMSLIDLSTAGGLKWSSLFQKHNLKLVKHEFQLSSVQLKLLKLPLWTCTAERDRERIWRSRLRERQPGGYWIWLKDCKRNIAHPMKIRQGILLPDGSNYEKELKKWFLSSDRHPNTSCVPQPRTLSSSMLRFFSRVHSLSRKVKVTRK